MYDISLFSKPDPSKPLPARSPANCFSLDVEGAEERVLLGFDFGRCRFKALLIERPSAAPREVLACLDYRLIKEMPELDCFYIHASDQEEYMKNVYRYSHRKHRLFTGDKQQ